MLVHLKRTALYIIEKALDLWLKGFFDVFVKFSRNKKRGIEDLRL